MITSRELYFLSDILLSKTMGVLSLENGDMESGEAVAGAASEAGY
jgi:hypothetical protein